MAGIVHIVIFAGFLILSIRSCAMVIIGISETFVMPGFDEVVNAGYHVLKDYTATVVLVACLIAAYQRVVTKPPRYAVPPKYGQAHTGEALFVLAMIATLMISESLFEASLVAAQIQASASFASLAPFTLGWIGSRMLASTSPGILQSLHTGAYFVHDIVFFRFTFNR